MDRRKFLTRAAAVLGAGAVAAAIPTGLRHLEDYKEEREARLEKETRHAKATVLSKGQAGGGAFANPMMNYITVSVEDDLSKQDSKFGEERFHVSGVDYHKLNIGDEIEITYLAEDDGRHDVRLEKPSE
jgi:hypothetical protein